MPAERLPLLRRITAGLVLVVAVSLVPGVVAAPAGALALPRQDPAPVTEPLAPEDPTGATSTTVDAAAEEDAAVDAAQQDADDDLRSVWVVVAALALVALGLLVLLVLYVRATNPARAAARREQLIARQEAKDAARIAKGKAPRQRRSRHEPDDDGGGDLDEADVDVAPAAAAAGAAAASRGRRRDAPAEAAAVDAPAPVAAPAAAAGVAAAAVLSRDPVPDEGVEVVKVVAAEGAVPLQKGPLRAEPARPAAARPASVGPAPEPAPTLPDTGETVRILGPAGRPPAAAVGMRAPEPGVDRDRPPPRALVETPSPAPPKRPRRVDAPAKRLGTPDAERVLVRPGQAPVRVPPAASGGAEPSTADPTSGGAPSGEAASRAARELESAVGTPAPAPAPAAPDREPDTLPPTPALVVEPDTIPPRSRPAGGGDDGDGGRGGDAR